MADLLGGRSESAVSIRDLMAHADVPVIKVSVPARPQFVQILRLVVGSVGTRVDLVYDDIQDLSVAVDEACAQLLSIKPLPTSMTLEIFIEQKTVHIAVSADAAPGEWPPSGFEESFGWQVLTAISDDPTFIVEEERAALKFSKKAAG